MQAIDNYGWTSAHSPSRGHLMPAVIQIARELGARKMLHLGCENGVLAAALVQNGFDVTGCDADAGGTELARRANLGIASHRIAVHDDPSALGDQDFDLFWSRATRTRLLEEESFHVDGFRGVGRLPFLWKSMTLTARKDA